MAVIQLAQIIGSTLQDYYEGYEMPERRFNNYIKRTQILKATLNVFEKLETHKKSTLLASEPLTSPSGSLQERVESCAI